MTRFQHHSQLRSISNAFSSPVYCSLDCSLLLLTWWSIITITRHCYCFNFWCYAYLCHVCNYIHSYSLALMKQYQNPYFCASFMYIKKIYISPSMSLIYLVSKSFFYKLTITLTSSHLEDHPSSISPLEKKKRTTSTTPSLHGWIFLKINTVRAIRQGQEKHMALMKAQPEHLFSCLFWRLKTWAQSETKKTTVRKVGAFNSTCRSEKKTVKLNYSWAL